MKLAYQTLVCFLLLTLLTGVVYPLAVTAISQLVFPWQANGSLLEQDGHTVGSALMGQEFTGSGYFWGRPSATSPVPYNGAASSGSNLGPLNPLLAERVTARADLLRKAHPTMQGAIPVDLLTASASGLDPHMSPAAAEYQVDRVARERGLTAEVVRRLVKEHTVPRQWHVFGEPHVNVLELNLTLDRLSRTP